MRLQYSKGMIQRPSTDITKQGLGSEKDKIDDCGRTCEQGTVCVFIRYFYFPAVVSNALFSQ